MEADGICRAIKSASRSQFLLSPQVAVLLAQLLKSKPASMEATPSSQPGPVTLTSREIDVMKLLGQGQTNKEIAYHLKLSEKTVKLHVSIILAKLNMQSRTQAALKAVQLGLLAEIDVTLSATH
jgi:DNA-binding NarL/FixJ family response regulator